MSSTTERQVASILAAAKARKEREAIAKLEAEIEAEKRQQAVQNGVELGYDPETTSSATVLQAMRLRRGR